MSIPLEERHYDAMQQIFVASPDAGKYISWKNSEILDHLKPMTNASTSRSILLDRKASVGPCKSRTASSSASGLTISVPKKSTRSLTEGPNCSAPVINITISKKSISRRCMSGVVTSKDMKNPAERRAVKVDLDIPYVKIITVMRNKIDILRFKFQKILHL